MGYVAGRARDNESAGNAVKIEPNCLEGQLSCVQYLKSSNILFISEIPAGF